MSQLEMRQSSPLGMLVKRHRLECANIPQAKGRVERANQTLQDRLVKELRLRGKRSTAEPRRQQI